MIIKSLDSELNEEVYIDTLININLFPHRLHYPFSDLSIDYLSTLSKIILDKYGIKSFSELGTLSYWLQKTNLFTFINDLEKGKGKNEIFGSPSLAFYIFSANIEIIFLYLWTLSIFAGTLNIVSENQHCTTLDDTP